MSDAITPEAAVGDMEPRALPFIFHGKGTEFFSIWIVNIALSIVTFGIYSAWAKVRTKRYFYGNMELDGHRFDYTAEPLQILKGRLLAIAVLFVLSIISGMGPEVSLLVSVLYIILIPVVIVLSTRFNASKSRYRNVPFMFTGSFGESYLVFLIYPLLGVLSLGLAMPWVHQRSQRFIYNNYRYGDRKFAAEFSVRDFYMIYLKGFVMFGLPALVLIGFWIASIYGGQLNGAPGEQVPMPNMLPFFAGYLLMFIFGGYIGVKILNLSVTNTVLDNRHGFTSTMGVARYLWITVSNFAAIILTIGLLYPWAQVRFTRFRSAHTTALAMGNLDDFASDVEETTSATSEGFADFLDIDLGF